MAHTSKKSYKEMLITEAYLSKQMIVYSENRWLLIRCWYWSVQIIDHEVLFVFVCECRPSSSCCERNAAAVAWPRFAAEDLPTASNTPPTHTCSESRITLNQSWLMILLKISSLLLFCISKGKKMTNETNSNIIKWCGATWLPSFQVNIGYLQPGEIWWTSHLSL